MAKLSVSKVGLVFIIGIFSLGLCPLAAETAKETPDSDKVQYVLEDIQGANVQVKEDGAKEWEGAQEGQVLESGDEIKLGDGSEATLMLQNETSVHLTANSDLKVEQIVSNETGGFLSRLKILTGKLLADVRKNLEASRSTFEVEANGVVCGVRGTAFEVNAQGDDVQTLTHEGKVEVACHGESHMVAAGSLSSFRLGRFLLQRRLDRTEVQRFQKWRAFRQIVRQKRLQRIVDIRNHRRGVWMRRHPRLRKAILRRQLKKMERRHLLNQK